MSAKIERSAIVSLAKEMNAMLGVKIPVTSATDISVIQAQIENNKSLLSSADFGNGKPGTVLSKEAKETFVALGYKVPKAGKKADEIVKETATKKAKTATKKSEPKEKKPTIADHTIEMVKEFCKKGATMKELSAKGAISPYSLHCLVAFNVLSLENGIYKLIK
jgi:hypothetical protein